MKGRQKENVSRVPMARSREILGKIHSDTGGPLPSTFAGHKYYVTFTDDATGTTWIRLLKHKSPDTFDEFRRWLVLIENQTEKKLKILISDWGTEYNNQPYRNYMEEKGIDWKPAAPYTPAQNGKSERKNLTIMGPVRSIMAEKKLPVGLWGEIAMAVVYIRNRAPCKALDSRSTPFEGLNYTKPDVSYFRVLGSRAWVHVPNTTARSKLDERSWQGIHVGYEGSNYRIYNPRTRKITICRDVVIDEDAMYKPGEEEDSFFPWTEEDDLALAGLEQEPSKEPATQTHSDPTYIVPPIVENAAESPYDINDEQGEQIELPKQNDRPKKQRLVVPEDFEPRGSTRSRGTGFRTHQSNFLTTVQERFCDDDVFTGPAPKSHLHMVRVLNALSKDESIGQATEPITYKQSLSVPDAPEWLQSREYELYSHHENKTWILVDLKEEGIDWSRVITGRWVFKVKIKADGTIKRKSRWVIHGYRQQQGIDYDETYASVVKATSYRTIIAWAAKYGLRLTQMDVVTAFLYGLLDELVYVIQPTGHEDGTGRVCKLLKALYGLKQAPRVWYSTIRSFLASLGFNNVSSDYCVFKSDDDAVIIALYVDDILIASKEGPRLDDLKLKLMERFRMTDMGEASQFLGLQIDRDSTGITLHQTQYMENILERFGMAQSATVSTPMDPGAPGFLLPSPVEADQATIKWYQAAVGSIMWPMIQTRPDLAYAVSILSRYCANPGSLHLKALDRVFRYIRGTKSLGLHYSCSHSGEDLVGWTDADYAGVADGRKSTGGYLYTFLGGPVSWASKRQTAVALSSTESEYMAMTEAAKEATWLQRFTAELGIRQKDRPVLLHADNQGAIALCTNPEFHRRTKHIDVAWHYIREVVIEGRINVDYVSTKDMVADGLTKALPAPPFRRYIENAGMR